MGIVCGHIKPKKPKNTGSGRYVLRTGGMQRPAGRYISGRTVTAGASVSGKVENAQDIQTWFTGYGLEVDGASITADKVKIPRKWDDSFAAFNSVVQQSGLDLARYKGKTVEKWVALIPAASKGDQSSYGVLLVYKKKPVGAYLLQKPSGLVTGLKDAQATMAQQVSGEDFSGDWGERHDDALNQRAQQTSGEDFAGDWGERHDDALNQRAQQTSGEDFAGDWGERHDEALTQNAQQTSGEDFVGEWESGQKAQQTSGEDFVGEWESGQNAQQTSGEDFVGEWESGQNAQQTSGEDFVGEWESGQNAQQTSGEDFVGEWESGQNAQQTSGEDFVGEWESGSSQAQYTDLPLDAEGYPVD